MNVAALFDLHGDIAVVTGGSGSLGAALSRGLSAAGAQVVIVSRRAETAAPVIAQVRADGGQAVHVACDVGDPAAVQAAAAEISATVGPVTILVNGAGGNQPAATTAPDRAFFDLDADALRHIVDLNFTSTLHCCQIFGRTMAERGHGCIVNIASMAALRPLTRVVAYSAAKAAVVNLTQWLAVHLAQEYSPRLRVNALAPGFFLAEQNRALLVDAATGALTPRGQAIVAHTPMGRLGQPDDLVGALLWLVSPAAAFVTGVVVPVDGGFAAFGGV